MKVYQICKKLRNEGGHTWPCLIWASNILTDNLTDNASTDTRGESSLKLISAYFPSSVSTLKHKDHQPLASASLINAFMTIVLYKYNIMHVQCLCCCCSELGHFALWLKAVTLPFTSLLSCLFLIKKLEGYKQGVLFRVEVDTRQTLFHSYCSHFGPSTDAFMSEETWYLNTKKQGSFIMPKSISFSWFML